MNPMMGESTFCNRHGTRLSNHPHRYSTRGCFAYPAINEISTVEYGPVRAVAMVTLLARPGRRPLRGLL
ncbi:MAG: hypothetical protein A07HR60_01789 [uncultured archaeon A07HR60]|nr:MAG: hypothetical protein A07HR60_01789 [uncultured archaeon A07HR60]